MQNFLPAESLEAGIELIVYGMLFGKLLANQKTQIMASVKHVENVPQTQLDTNMAKTKPVKLGWKPEQIDKISHALNSVLANYNVHFQKLRNFHWNVTGSDFFDLHMEFEEQYKEALDHIDEIAERIRIFGETPFGTMQEYLNESEIKESSSTQMNSDLMVRELLSDYRILLQYLNAILQIATEQHDAGTENMVKGFIKKIEKHHWMLSSFLAK
ncbi:MAG TPA: DNA starvation/stationary phase protection protein [Chryseolinea sp.]|nr:DNA starvation/stationary phase protection protein [Chryseolinea sp.]